MSAKPKRYEADRMLAQAKRAIAGATLVGVLTGSIGLAFFSNDRHPDQRRARSHRPAPTTKVRRGRKNELFLEVEFLTESD